MTYEDFRDSIARELQQIPAGLTWTDLKGQLDLPYERPCPEWVRRLEKEIGLVRERVNGRALTWKLRQSKPASRKTHQRDR